MSRLKKCFSNWLHSAQPRKCPHCDHQAEENEMLEHLNYCQSMTYRKETSDGSVETIVEQTTSQPTNKTFNNNVNECKSIPRFVQQNMLQYLKTIFILILLILYMEIKRKTQRQLNEKQAFT